MKTVPAIAAVLTAAALIAPTVSHAEEARSTKVSYADLNLASQAGQDLLQHRLVRAAGFVCEYGKRQDLVRMSEAASCRSDTLASVQPAYLEAVDAARHGVVRVLEGAVLIVTAP
jgi:UrcA family protein